MDKNSLEKELTTAFVKDATRKAEDSMKKRAILTARSYDEFRHLVAAATQKPIDKQDITKKAEVSANKSYLGTTSTHIQRRNDSIGFGITLPSASSSLSSSPSSTSKLSQVPTSISTRSDIEKAWRRLPKHTMDRYKYLLSLGPTTLENVFKYEIDGTMLGDFLQILSNGLHELKDIATIKTTLLPSPTIEKSNNSTSTNNSETNESLGSSSSSMISDDTSVSSPVLPYEQYVTLTSEILFCLTKTGRFDLALALLSKDELNCVRYITEECKAFPGLNDQRERLEQSYSLQ